MTKLSDFLQQRWRQVDFPLQNFRRLRQNRTMSVAELEGHGVACSDNDKGNGMQHKPEFGQKVYKCPRQMGCPHGFHLHPECQSRIW